MKKLFIVLAFVGVAMTSQAQEEDPTLKYSVATNSFWSNWFIQVGAQWTAFYTSAEHGQSLSKSPFKSFRTNPEAAIAIGKWFTPGIGLRTKVSGIWGKAYGTSFKYWNAQEQVLFNLSNMLCGYNPDRVYNFVPFAGAGIARNCSYNTYAMGLSVGILNQFYVSKKIAINFELGWNRLENDVFSANIANNGDRGWDSHDNLFYAEIGLTLNLGKSTWEKTPDVDAIKALSQAQIDALKAQLDDANAENARLKQMLANQPKPEKIVETVKEIVAAPVSVFFNIDRTEIANKNDLINVQELVKYAKENDCNLIVTGYADSATGKPGRNQWLSEKRAERVAGEIVNMGVDESKITKEAKGGVDILSPISLNRRAVVEIAQ